MRKRCPTAESDEEKMRAKEQKKKKKQVEREPILSFTRSTDSFIQLFQEHVIIYDIYKKDTKMQKIKDRRSGYLL